MSMVESTYFFTKLDCAHLGCVNIGVFCTQPVPRVTVLGKVRIVHWGHRFFFTSKMVWGWKEGECQPIASKIGREVSLQNAGVLPPLATRHGDWLENKPEEILRRVAPLQKY